MYRTIVVVFELSLHLKNLHEDVLEENALENIWAKGETM
jgi:hypothetical protein